MADRLTAEPPSLSRAERPNTVFGLLDKRAELVKLQQQLETDLRKVICDIDHLDAAIRLFDPETTNEARARYATQHRAKKGHVIRFVLEWLRPASGAPRHGRSRTPGLRRAGSAAMTRHSSCSASGSAHA
jgi:hypothetical protein